MRITTLTYGSRGDVQPYIAVGRGLQRAGHQVRLAAPRTSAGAGQEDQCGGWGQRSAEGD